MRVISMGLLVAVIAAGCKGLPNMPGLRKAAPEVTFKDLKIKAIDFQKIDTRFVLQVRNPYPVNLKLKSFDWALALAGEDFVDGTGGRLDIKPSGASPVGIPVSMKWAQAFRVAGAMKGTDEIPYALHTDMSFDTPFGVIRVPLDHDGMLPALHTPQLSLKALRLEGIDLVKQKASLELDVGVTSDQASTISFDAFRYDIALNGSKAVSGRTTLPRIDGTGTMTLPIDLNLLQLGAGVVSTVKNKGDLTVGLDASIDVGTPFGAVPLTIDKSRSLSIR